MSILDRAARRLWREIQKRIAVSEKVWKERPVIIGLASEDEIIYADRNCIKRAPGRKSRIPTDKEIDELSGCVTFFVNVIRLGHTVSSSSLPAYFLFSSFQRQRIGKSPDGFLVRCIFLVVHHFVDSLGILIEGS